MIELAGLSFFDSGSADIRASMESSLIGLNQVIVSLPVQSYKAEIESHTDNAPINTSAFPSNWKLAALRSIIVLHLFQEKSISKQKLSVPAFADTRRTFLNTDGNNEPIAENQAKNRRVVVHILNITAAELLQQIHLMCFTTGLCSSIQSFIHAGQTCWTGVSATLNPRQQKYRRPVWDWFTPVIPINFPV